MARALGRYELLRPLARGGMAEVFLARRRTAGVEKILVIKRIRPERAGDARFLALFVREARLSMSLTHQNIVPVFDFGRAADQVFLAMERVEGKDLGSSLERAARPPPPLVAAFIAAECCQALAYAHERRGPDGAALGVVHRDVTPRNVLVSWSGEVKLSDFGIAALAGDEAGRLIGTPAYMAPEQARGEPLDPRADVYAVGVVLREALTGRRARPGADRAALLDAARRGALAPWPDGADPQAAPLRAIADRATAPRPDDRFPTAAALGAALDEFLVGARAALRGESPARQLAAWMEEVWRGARDEPLAAPLAGGDELRSLVDDGAIGTGTARSLAATGTDDAAAGAGDRAPPPPRSDPAGRALVEPVPAPRRRRWIAGAALLAAIVAAVIAVPRLRRGAPAALEAAEDAARRDAWPADAAPFDASPRDAAAIGEPPLDAPLDAPPLDAMRADARRDPVRGDGGGLSGVRPDGGARPVPLDAARVLRRVRINARPWARFTVDDDPTEHETISTIELAPGPHRVRFHNPQLGVERTVTIVVPADRDLDHVEDLRR